MITKARVVLQHGKTTTDPIEFTDSHGIAVGNEYMLNLNGKTVEWKIIKIETTETTDGKVEPRTDD